MAWNKALATDQAFISPVKAGKHHWHIASGVFE
ncbi:hypothetical protein M2298_000764 [Brevibacillus sp. 1238]|nr:hypothetical protein [Brevibacillus sp. 1238]